LAKLVECRATKRKLKVVIYRLIFILLGAIEDDKGEVLYYMELPTGEFKLGRGIPKVKEHHFLWYSHKLANTSKLFNLLTAKFRLVDGISNNNIFKEYINETTCST